jgi:hypothetical protein
MNHKRTRAVSVIDALERRALFSGVAAMATMGQAEISAATIATPRAAPAVTSFTLINADTDQPIMTLAAGATLNLATLPTKRLNVRANVNSSTVSVKFAYDANANYRVDSGPPYAFAGNSGTDYFAWTPTVGTHTIKATPYAASGATGASGAAYSVTFKVVNGVTTPSVTIVATDANAKEPTVDTGTFTISRTGSTTNPLTVNLSLSGVATEGLDYEALPRTVTIPAGSTWALLTVRPIDDGIAETTETITLKVASGSGYVVGAASTGTVKLADDDSPVTQAPYLGTPFVVPSGGLIEAENFDVGGNIVSFRVPQSLYRPNDYRTGFLPPISASTDPNGGGYVLDQIPGESFMEYTTNVTAAGLYTVKLRYAAGGSGGVIHIQANDVNLSGPVTLPSTGGWNQWQTLSIPGLALAAGPQVLGITFETPAVAGESVASVNWFSAELQASPLPPAPPAGSLLAKPSPVATPVGATGLALSWAAPEGVDVAGIQGYRVSFTVGDYVAGAAGQKQVIDLPATQTSVLLGGLVQYAMYTIDVQAIDAAGNASAAGRITPFTGKPANMKRYMYTFHLPKDVTGFKTLAPRIEVYDADNGYAWVKNIPLPSGIYNVRGVAASVPTNKLYITYFLSPINGYQRGGLLCLDLTTNKVLFRRDYAEAEVGSPDRFDITPDGKTIYMPVGEHGTQPGWVVIDASNGNPTGFVPHVTSAHNTIVSLDGKYAFLEGQEKGVQTPGWEHTVAMVDTTNHQVIRRIGPFRDVVRPFTVNGDASLMFSTMNNWMGFQVADTATGQILYTITPPGYPRPDPNLNKVHSHGIALTPDQKRLFVVDTLKVGVHVWDVSLMPNSPPTYLGFIQTRRTGRNLAGVYIPEAANDATGVPAWLNISYDGKYLICQNGEIIDTATLQIVGQVRNKTLDAAGNVVKSIYSHSRFILEVQTVGGKPFRVGKQFAIGKVR